MTFTQIISKIEELKIMSAMAPFSEAMGITPISEEEHKAKLSELNTAMECAIDHLHTAYLSDTRLINLCAEAFKSCVARHGCYGEEYLQHRMKTYLEDAVNEYCLLVGDTIPAFEVSDLKYLVFATWSYNRNKDKL